MVDVISRRRRDTVRPSRNGALVAAASIVQPSRNLRLQNYSWQTEAWQFYRKFEAFKYGVMWRAQMMSRVRLTAAVIEPGGDEPSAITEGVASDLMREFFGGPTGQSQYMRSITTQLDVPGEGYVVAEDDMDDEDGRRAWCVRSNSEIRTTTGKAFVDGRMKPVPLWEVEVENGAWRTLPFETHVFKQWRPDEEKHWRPDSPAQSLLGTMRIIDLMLRRIMAQSVSRLASNGLLLYPQEVTFPPKPGFEKEADPFTAEWLDIAGKTIANPGSATAAIPLPIKVPQQYIKDFTHLDFANTYDERVMEILRFMVELLATGMNFPKEVLTGMGDTSHWNAWSLDEQSVKAHIEPDAELIVQGLTKGYLHPALKALGESTLDSSGAEYIVWYDTSELVQPPDMSTAANDARDRHEISGKAFRRLKSLSEDDKPDDTELRRQLLLDMAKDPASAPIAIEELTGTPVAGAKTGPGGVDGEAPPPQPPPATGPPDRPTERETEPAPPAGG